jgi:hypothetical protein
MSSTTRTTGEPTGSGRTYRAIYQKGREAHRQGEEALPELGPLLDADLMTIEPDSSDDESGIAAYTAYGRTVFDFLLDALRANRDEDARRVFALTEDLAASNDVYAQSVVATEIAYQLVNVGLNDRARPLMGPATRELLKSQEELVARASSRHNPIFRFIEGLVRRR